MVSKAASITATPLSGVMFIWSKPYGVLINESV
jgi:hypothetical protein